MYELEDVVSRGHNKGMFDNLLKSMSFKKLFKSSKKTKSSPRKKSSSRKKASPGKKASPRKKASRKVGGGCGCADKSGSW